MGFTCGIHVSFQFQVLVRSHNSCEMQPSFRHAGSPISSPTTHSFRSVPPPTSTFGAFKHPATSFSANSSKDFSGTTGIQQFPSVEGPRVVGVSSMSPVRKGCSYSINSSANRAVPMPMVSSYSPVSVQRPSLSQPASCSFTSPSRRQSSVPEASVRSSPITNTTRAAGWRLTQRPNVSGDSSRVSQPQTVRLRHVQSQDSLRSNMRNNVVGAAPAGVLLVQPRAQPLTSPPGASLQTVPPLNEELIHTTENVVEEKLPRVEVEEDLNPPRPEPYSEIPNFPMPEGLDGIPIAEILEAIPPVVPQGL